jgi:hypothetical protein
VPIDQRLVERLYRQAKGERWRTPMSRFAQALDASAERALAGRTQDSRALERYLASLHLEDLALACACAEGDDGAWEHFVLEQRPLLYRAADVLDPSGGARDLADALYADLFGLENRGGERRSLFRYFHGRSGLTTSRPIEPDRDRYLGLIRKALERSVAGLAPRDRLRLSCYYAQELTLAQTGRMLGEHEATSSRQLARTRAAIRDAVDRRLRAEDGLGDAEVALCFEYVTEDAGALDLRAVIEADSSHSGRKESAPDRSG